MKYLSLICAVLFFTPCAWSADVYVEKDAPHKHCPLRGSATANSKKAAENILKNRWNTPAPTDFDNRITSGALIRPGNDRT